jgi:hypothetical protein
MPRRKPAEIASPNLSTNSALAATVLKLYSRPVVAALAQLHHLQAEVERYQFFLLRHHAAGRRRSRQ